MLEQINSILDPIAVSLNLHKVMEDGEFYFFRMHNSVANYSSFVHVETLADFTLGEWFEKGKIYLERNKPMEKLSKHTLFQEVDKYLVILSRNAYDRHLDRAKENNEKALDHLKEAIGSDISNLIDWDAVEPTEESTETADDGTS